MLAKLCIVMKLNQQSYVVIKQQQHSNKFLTIYVVVSLGFMLPDNVLGKPEFYVE